MVFVATAPLSAAGHINCSPKGMDTFRILDKNSVCYMDLTGSGIETTAHLFSYAKVIELVLLLRSNNSAREYCCEASPFAGRSRINFIGEKRQGFYVYVIIPVLNGAVNKKITTAKVGGGSLIEEKTGGKRNGKKWHRCCYRNP
jgi:hypothetical protein